MISTSWIIDQIWKVGLFTATHEEAPKRFFQKIDPLVLIAALPTLFLALSNEAWWTLTGVNNNKLFSVKVSPYYVSIMATGFSANLSAIIILGSIARLLAIIAFVTLLVSGLRPSAWWRNFTFYGGMTSLLGLYLSFLIMYHDAQTAFLSLYNVIIPYSGQAHLSANILGLDLKYYSSPLVAASFSIAFYLGFLAIGLAMSGLVWRTFRNRIFALALIPGGIRDIHLSPPYHHVWISSTDTDLNPLYEDPDHSTDDQLLVSFEKLYKTVDPGGSLSIILPAWATRVGDRFLKLLPYTGFNVESSNMIYRTPGVPETELRFRKPLDKVNENEPSPSEREQPTNPTLLISPPTQTTTEHDDHPPSGLPTQPEWVPTKTTSAERAMLRSAINMITEQQAPIAYRELLNRVYMDLVDKKIDFESSRQIETTLIKHTGKELELVEEADSTGARWIRKWWLGEGRILLEKESGPNLISRMITQVKNVIPRRSSKRKSQRSRARYRPRAWIEDD